MMTILMMMMTMMIILMAKERELAEESAHDKRPKCQPIGRQLDCRWHYYDHGPWSSMVTYDDKYDDRYRVPTRVNNCGWMIMLIILNTKVKL